ncbi:hypothetical protein HMJ29_12980 [Hymenobacter taeanensis]|uniref:Uncharacterized protein n=1 Tax=Hymenobacter taeanensis TaxID=2735321 RepID=A0A6M6BI76_9BACT|nr:hypothetical protein [Hymenobacter taeanensis]QJX47806.1 hypothetical protein HMJ29_12980 [Hymenobacter taeanensis]
MAKKISEQRHLFGKRSNYTARITANLAAKGKAFTRQQVYNVVTGRYFNMDIAEAFFEELEAELKRRAHLEARANQPLPA